MSSGTEIKYVVEMLCSNCDQKVRMWFLKGTKVPEQDVQCPNCGCFALSQTHNATPQPVVRSSEKDDFNWFVRAIDTFFNRRKAQ